MNPTVDAGAAVSAMAYDYCTRLVADMDKDRYLASLFIDQAVRPHIHALQAFNVELARVRDMVSEPLPGEVRLQWWRDVVMATARGDVEAHPVAFALLDTMKRYTLPQTTLLDMIDARTFDLYDDVMPTLNDLEGYCGETASALFQLSAIVACGGGDPEACEMSGYAGVAYAVSGLLKSVGFHARRNQVYLPKDLLERHGVDADDIRHGHAGPGLDLVLAILGLHAKQCLERAEHQWPRLPDAVRSVYLPLAVIGPLLKRLEQSKAGVLRTPVNVPQWRGQLALWLRARKLGRIRAK